MLEGAAASKTQRMRLHTVISSRRGAATGGAIADIRGVTLMPFFRVIARLPPAGAPALTAVVCAIGGGAGAGGASGTGPSATASCGGALNTRAAQAITRIARIT